MRMLVLLSDRAKLTAELVAIIAFESVSTFILMAFCVSCKRLLVDALGIAESAKRLSVVKVMELYFGQKCGELQDVGIILLNQLGVVFKGAANFLELNLTLMVFVLAPWHLFVAKIAFDL